MKAWKVARVGRSGGFRSTQASDTMEVRYPLGHWAEPWIVGSPLFAFYNSQDAKKFAIGCSEETVEYVVLECEAELFEDWQPDRTRIPSLGVWGPANCAQYWSAQVEERFLLGSWPVPLGTVLCTKLKPLRKVLL